LTGAGSVEPRVLDLLAGHPFYADYKQRLLALAGVHEGGRYLDVGAGTGRDAGSAPGTWTALDRSGTMAQHARANGPARVVVGDVLALPFEEATFDGCRADRVLQYVAEAPAAVGEMARVTKRGGTVVVADPDYDTQVVAIDDARLARQVRIFRRDVLRFNGAFAHDAVAAFGRAGLVDVVVEATTLVVRDPEALDNVMGLRTWGRLAEARGNLAPGDGERWERELDDAVERGSFLYAVTFFLTAGRRA
jgi:SAM-dependent methyltransferase